LLNDDALRSGDIVSTDKGLLLFRGRSGPDGEAGRVCPDHATLIARVTFFLRLEGYAIAIESSRCDKSD
jgi:hypothetical protein